MVICMFSACETIPPTKVAMFDTLSPMNAIVYWELERLSLSRMKGTYLVLDMICAKSVPNSIHKIFSSMMSKQLMEIDKTFLC
jgi:hypothetical protein